jgi:lipoprotein-anchoring transpeptidase ErfK/SrfK
MKRIEIFVGTQRLTLWDGGNIVGSWPCSTSKFGIGSEEGSNRTPLGAFVIREKHGAGAPYGTIFKSRQPAGLWAPGQSVAEDLVLSRILWLHGQEPHNANTFQRYIYIHGTNDEHGIGRPLSHGCIRLRNLDVIDLFDRVETGTPVWIEI